MAGPYGAWMFLDLLGSTVLGTVLAIWGHRNLERHGMTLGFVVGGIAWLPVGAALHNLFG